MVNKLPSASITDFEVRREFKRKSLHLPGLLVPFCYQWAPWATLLGISLVIVFYYFSEIRRVARGKPLPLMGFFTQRLIRSTHLDLAPIYLATGLGVAALLFPFRAALAGALLVCLGDGVAAVVGMKFGKHRLPLLKKTYLGTLAFFVTSAVVLIPLLGWEGALLTAAAASLIEAFSIEGIDNLLLPVLGAWLAQYFL